MGKNVAVYVDVANIFYAAKAAGVDIDYVTLLKTASAGRDLVRAYAYTGLDPDNENQRNFHDFLRRHGYKVVSKDIRKYGDGKVKANLDIELVVDMMKTARNLDIAIVVSGDGDFAPAIRAVQEMGVRVEVISFRGNTSSDLIEVADQFTEITQIARVEKGSSRSGRRVADDEEDLSMTEVPDKLSEGTGRGRGRGRGRGKAAEGEPVAAAPRSRSRARTVASPDEGPVAAVTAGGTPLVVLPGEKLSRVAAVAPQRPPPTQPSLLKLPRTRPHPAPSASSRSRATTRNRAAAAAAAVAGVEVVDEATPTDSVRTRPVWKPVLTPVRTSTQPRMRPRIYRSSRRVPVACRPLPSASRRRSDRSGIPRSACRPPAAGSSPTPTPANLDEEDFDEPPIPEYLIAERRQRDNRGGAGGGRGGPSRGARGSYSSAVDRERYGGGRSSSGSSSGGQGRPSRYAEPAPRGNREPERFRQDRPAPQVGASRRVAGRAVERGPAGDRGDAASPARQSRRGSSA